MSVEKILIALGFLVQLGIFLKFSIAATRWLYKRTRNNEINQRFVHDVATNHLPHLYDGQKRIAAHLGVDLPDPPPIQFIELNGHRKREDDDDDEG